MGALMLLGGLLIGYCVPVSIFFLLLWRRAQLVIIMLGSAFFWLLSLFISSIIWSAIPPLKDSSEGWAIIPVAVLIQEVVRGVFIRLYFRWERSFSITSINAIVFPLIDLWSSIAAGVGWGAAQSFTYYAPILALAWGPGALFHPKCEAFSSFTGAAWNAFFFNILHILWMILGFDAYRNINPLKAGIILVLHGAAAGMTILNNTQDGCVLSLPLIAVIVVVTAVWTIIVTHRPDYRSNKAKRIRQD